MIHDLSQQPQGTLRLTASVSFGQRCLVPRLPAFRQRYPDLGLELVLTDSVVDLFAERIDVAIRLGMLPDSSLIAQRLMLTYYRVCASPGYLSTRGYPRYPADMVHHDCLRFSLAGFRSRWIFKDSQGAISEVPVHGRLIVSNALALQQCAIAGLGLALLPNWLIDQELKNGTLVDVFPSYEVTATEFGTSAWWVLPSRSYIPHKVKIFMDYFNEVLTPPAG